MKFTAIAAVGIALIAAASASAAERVTDSEFIKASRCRALASSDALGPMDTGAVDAFLRSEGRGRQPTVVSMAKQAEISARREAKSADRKTRLDAELNGACVAYLRPAGASGQQ